MTVCPGEKVHSQRGSEEEEEMVVVAVDRRYSFTNDGIANSECDSATVRLLHMILVVSTGIWTMHAKDLTKVFNGRSEAYRTSHLVHPQQSGIIVVMFAVTAHRVPTRRPNRMNGKKR